VHSATTTTRYLRKALTTLANQYVGKLAERTIQVLVVNNSPKDHKGVDIAIDQVLKMANGTTLRVALVDGNEEFDDPFDPNLKLKVDLPGRPDLLESWTPSRTHCRHVVETFSRALEISAKYVVVSCPPCACTHAVRVDRCNPLRYSIASKEVIQPDVTISNLCSLLLLLSRTHSSRRT
jgi:hypothetical protein